MNTKYSDIYNSLEILWAQKLGMMLCLINTLKFLNKSKSYIALVIQQYRPLWIEKSEW